MKNGGSGYFPMRIVLPHIAAKRLHVVAGAPEFSMPAYVAYPVDSEREVIRDAVALMHRVAASATKSNAAGKPARRAAASKR
ncbi:MAG: LysR family transcriptional regulator, partial [Afipia sp.]|nr:LysR family transcriptional regulator [Afipia sp.]